MFLIFNIYSIPHTLGSLDLGPVLDFTPAKRAPRKIGLILVKGGRKGKEEGEASPARDLPALDSI